MARPFKTIDDEEKYQEQDYEKNFNSVAYYEEYIEDRNDCFEFAMIALTSAFSLDVKTGDSLLDFGCGPDIYASIIASKYYRNIVVSDFLERNRETIRKWLRNDSSDKDFKCVFKSVAALEHESDITKLEARVRNSVKDVIPCNMHLSNPIAPDQRTFDVVISTYAPEVGSVTLESYRKSIKNIANLLKPGGKFLYAIAVKSSYYCVGGHRFQNVNLTKHDVKQAVIDAGLNPYFWLSRPFAGGLASDCQSVLFVKCIKDGK